VGEEVGVTEAEAFAAAYGVSRETLARLERYVALLRRWQPAQNLVSSATLDEVWARHVADSAQLLALAPGASAWLDLGSGAGLPGIVIGCMLPESGRIRLVESNQRKCAFLRAAIRETGARADVTCARIESALKGLAPVEIVTARAVAPLGQLCQWVAPLVTAGARCLFHKGREIDQEIAEASLHWRIDLLEHRSRVASGSWVLEIRGLERIAG
jgi:16S rRNA (guanine527-N7)-methyltransferase